MVMSVVQVPASEPVLHEVRTALVQRLSDSDASVRLAAIRGIGTIGPKLADEPIAGLVAALQDESEKNRAAAALALASFPRGLSALLPSLVRSLDHAPEQSNAALLDILEHSSSPRFSPEAFLGLVAALASRDPQVIRLAAADLVAFRPAAGRVVPDLARALDRLIGSESKGTAVRDQETQDLIVLISESLEALAPNADSPDAAVTVLARLLGLDIDRAAESPQQRPWAGFTRPQPCSMP